MKNLLLSLVLIPFFAFASDDTLPGGWTAFTTEIDLSASAAFDRAFDEFVGESYEVLAVSSQVVQGVNYRYFCNAKGSYPGAQVHPTMVTIYVDLNGIPQIKEIKDI